MDFQFRNAKLSDIAGILALWKECFPKKPKAHWEIINDRLISGINTDRIFVRLALDETGEIIGAVQHQIDHILIGKSVLTNSHIGNVSISPSLQGQGLGSKLMQDSIDYLLKNEQIHMALLGGLVKFYRRFGFSPSQASPYISIPIKDVRGGVKVIPFSETVKIKNGNYLKKIRQFDPVHDKEEYFRLQNPSRGKRIYDSGDYRFEHVERKHYDELKRLVYDDSGELLAYVFAYNDNNIFDLGSKDNERGIQALSDLIRLTLLQLDQKEYSELRIDGGNMRKVELALQREKIAYRQIIRVGGIASNMVHVPSVRRLFQASIDELNYRLHNLPVKANVKIGFNIANDSPGCVLCIENNKIVKIVDYDKVDVDINLIISMSDLLQGISFKTIPESNSIKASSLDMHIETVLLYLLGGEIKLNKTKF